MEGQKVSGIYIPGMEMPKNCYECPIRRRRGLYIICTVTEDEFSIADENILFYRLENCPLIPVPEHGRLIDADKLGIRDAEKQAYEAYLREKNEFFVEEPLLEYMRGRLEGLTNASGRVRFAPTIIPADRKEGEG